MDGTRALFDVNASIQKHIAMLKPWFPTRAVVCIGEYPVRILLKGQLTAKTEDALPVFVDKSSKDISKWSPRPLDEHSFLGLDMDVEGHFWFDVLPHITKNGFMSRLKNTSVDKVHEAVVVASTWEAFASALLPTFLGQSKAWNLNYVAFAVLPSKLQPPDAQFNAFSCLGMCVSKDFTPILLLHRDQLEGYVGVDRQGSIIKGNAVLDYVLEIVLTKETFVQDMFDLLKPFNTRMCGVLAVTGASLRIYGSLENILSTTLVKPLTEFDLASASLVYVVVRLPLKLKDKLSKGKIELAVADWFSSKANLRSVYVGEPIYVEDAFDRIDLVMVVGGFNTTKMFASMEKEVGVIKNPFIEKGFIKKEEWQAIAKSLLET
ncbi:MAG TPA: hypothetical protein VJ066_05265 [Candidatus Bathyarchaeia archaeon]|nr:hypothetical protein [Candidatus Bathyarchaeia archaeon]